MNQRAIIGFTADYVRNQMTGEATGHDWYHIERVWKLAKRIGRGERVDLFVVEVSALLHDIADWKFSGDEYASARIARKLLKKNGVDERTIQHVEDIINNLSFKGATTKAAKLSPEGRVVQDADRLDALGAIGIGRTFAYGGHVGNPMYDPELKVVRHSSFESYKNRAARRSIIFTKSCFY